MFIIGLKYLKEDKIGSNIFNPMPAIYYVPGFGGGKYENYIEFFFFNFSSETVVW